MARRTIAERAAAGEIRSIQGLTREEQGELLVWARAQGIQYREITRRFGFTLTEEGLRTWWRVITLNHPDRVPRFTATDDRLLLQAVQLYGTGSLDKLKSFEGIWSKVKSYIRANGGTTTAGAVILMERWRSLRGQRGEPVPPVPPRAGRRKPAQATKAAVQAPTAATAQPQASLARSFPVPLQPVQPSSSAQPPSAQPRGRRAGTKTSSSSAAAAASANPDLEWGHYEPLSKAEMKEVLGDDADSSDEESSSESSESSSDSGEDGPEWDEYEPLSEAEMREVMGEDESKDDNDSEQDD